MRKNAFPTGKKYSNQPSKSEKTHFEKRERIQNDDKTDIKIYKKHNDSIYKDGMQNDGIYALNYCRLIEIDFTTCSVCGKKIRALDDMKIKDAFYCTKCKMNAIDGKSEKDILLMRKNELLMELAEIDYRLDYLKTIFDS